MPQKVRRVFVQGLHLSHQASVGRGVTALELGGVFGRHGASRLPQEGVGEEAPAHADAPMDAPDREVDAGGVQRLAPSGNSRIWMRVRRQMGAGQMPRYTRLTCSCRESASACPASTVRPFSRMKAVCATRAPAAHVKNETKEAAYYGVLPAK